MRVSGRLVGIAVAAACALAPASASATTPGTPGTPQAGNPVYLENFENGTGANGVGIQNYTGGAAADNESYTTSPIYKSTAANCNGWIMDSATPAASVVSDPCVVPWVPYTQAEAKAVGLFEGESAGAAAANHILVEYTGPANNTGIELETSPNQIPAVPGHFYEAQAIYDAVDYQGGGAGCDFFDPSIYFYLLNGATQYQVGSALDPCTAPGGRDIAANGVNVRIAQLISGAMKWSGGSTMGVEQYNAQASGTGNDGGTDNIEVVDATPQLDKSFSPSTITLGHSSTLTFTVTNTNELDAKNGWSFTDNLSNGLTIAAPSGETTTCSGATVTAPANGTSIAVTGNLTQGQKSCTVSVNVTAALPGSYTNDSSNVTGSGVNPPGSSTLTVNGVPAVSIKKSGVVTPAADQAAAQVGDTISYQYTVTNTGDDALASISVSDPSIGSVTCDPLGPGGLAPGASDSCTSDATHVVTQADVDAGKVTDTATATGTDQGGITSPQAQANATVDTVAPAPSLMIQKYADAAGGDTNPITLGESVQFSYTVTNTGNVDMKPISVLDPTAGPVTCDPLPASGLAPGASVGCKATNAYKVMQTDVDNGQLIDTATASGTDPAGKSVTSQPAQAQLNSAPDPLVGIQKKATVSPAADQGAAKLGDTIAYTYVVTNIGNVTLKSVSVSDPSAGSVSCAPLPAGGLAPDATVDCHAGSSHTVNQGDLDAGEVVDTATATGVDTQGSSSPKSDPSQATVQTVAPVITDSIQKSGTVTPSADQNSVQVGDTIHYTYTVTNTGNVDQPSVSVDDPTVGPVSCQTPPAPGLAPGKSEQCSSETSYTVTQADVDAGSVVDKATATPTGPGGEIGPPSKPATDTIDAQPPSPLVQITKHAAVTPTADANAVQVGDSIAYSYDVKNTGNVTLASLAVDDPSAGTVTCAPPTPPGLAPGQTETCYADAPHLVTQADVDAGSVVDTATATGTDTNGNLSPQSNKSTVTEDAVAPNPSISIKKIANCSCGDQNTPQPGDTISYTYLVKNTGNVTLTGVGVNDSAAGQDPVSCPQTTLAPNDSEQCTAAAVFHVTTAGGVTDTATATGMPPTGPPVTGTDQITVPTTANPSVSIQKTATVSPSTDQNDIQVGDTVAYGYVITNTGNDPLTSYTLHDSKIAGSNLSCPTQPPIPPGGHVNCSTINPVTVTQADVDAGSIVNTATVNASDGTSNVSGQDTAAVYSQPAPLVQLSKTATVTPAGDQSAVRVGDKIAYTYTLENTGNVTLKSVNVSDPTAGNVTCDNLPVGGLAPGGSVNCAADSSYTVTQADVDAGKVFDEAAGTGTDGLGHKSPPSTGRATVEAVPPDPMITLKKVDTVSPAADQNAIKIGDKISYSYVITNTGNVDLKDAEVTDPTLGAVTCPAPSGAGLAPGASETCTANNRHTVTQSDVDAGLTDRATAIVIDPPIGPPTPEVITTNTVPPNPHPSVTVVKTATVDPKADQNAVKQGDKVAYTFKVTNTGNVDLKAIAVSDPTLGRVSCPTFVAPGLAPGASATCRGEVDHLVTATDVKNGKITNTATATGTDIKGNTSGNSKRSTATVDAAHAARALKLKKIASRHAARAGTDITYTLTVSNPGTVTVKHATVCDQLPRGLVYIRSTPRAHLNTGRWCWTIAKLAGHAAKRLRLTVNITRTRRGRITNRATATAKGLRRTTATAMILDQGAHISPCATGSRALTHHGRRPPTARPAC